MRNLSRKRACGSQFVQEEQARFYGLFDPGFLHSSDKGASLSAALGAGRHLSPGRRQGRVSVSFVHWPLVK